MLRKNRVTLSSFLITKSPRTTLFKLSEKSTVPGVLSTRRLCNKKRRKGSEHILKEGMKGKEKNGEKELKGITGRI